MKVFKQITQTIVAVAILGLAGAGCKKDAHVPPTMAFKTGAGYTSADGAAARNVTLKVGITADKVEDDMITYNVSYAYDGATTTTTSQNFTLTGAELEHYDKDVTFLTRNMAGSEKWIFTITDKDGNIVQKSVTLTIP